MTSLPETMWRRLRPLVRSSLLRHVAATTVTRVGSLAVTFALGVLVARALGPQGRGQYALAISLAGLVAQFGNLGLHASNTYYLSRDPKLLRTLTGNTLGVTAAVAVVCAVAATITRIVFPGAVPLPLVMLVLVVVAAPINVAVTLIQNLALGYGDVKAFNGSELLARLITVIATLTLLLAAWISPSPFFAATVLGPALATAWLGARLVRAGGGLAMDRNVFRQTWGYGARAYVAGLASFVVLRVDVVLLGAMTSLKATGLYSVAVSLGDITLLFPTVVGTILFPRLSAIQDPARRWHVARTVTFTVAAVMAAACALAAILARPVIELLYGHAYSGASSAYLVLLPGLFFLSVTSILNNFLASVGMPIITVIAPIVAGLVNVAANLVLIPRAGINGSAAASTLAYGLMLLGAGGYVAWRSDLRGRSTAASSA